MSREVWLPVVGYEGLYEASSFGRVRSVDNKGQKHNYKEGRILKQRNVGNGYTQVTLCNGQAKKQMLVHRIICTAFHGIPPNEKYQVDHLNRVRNDNRAENLEWVTCSENLKRVGAKQGKLKPVVHCFSNGSEKKYPSIKSARQDGFSYSQIYRSIKQNRQLRDGSSWSFL